MSLRSNVSIVKCSRLVFYQKQDGVDTTKAPRRGENVKRKCSAAGGIAHANLVRQAIKL